MDTADVMGSTRSWWILIDVRLAQPTSICQRVVRDATVSTSFVFHAMPELLIMRHAKSAWDTGHADFDRPLAGRGIDDRARMARWLADNDLAPDRIVTSGAVRARETASHVAHTCGLAEWSVEVDDRLYHAGAVQWLGRIRDQPDHVQRLLICGHNPSLDHLVETLSSTRPPLTASGKLMTTSAIAHLTFDTAWQDVAPVSGTLAQLARPR